MGLTGVDDVELGCHGASSLAVACVLQAGPLRDGFTGVVLSYLAASPGASTSL